METFIFSIPWSTFFSSSTEVFFFCPGKVGNGLSHAGWSGDIGGVFKGLREDCSKDNKLRARQRDQVTHAAQDLQSKIYPEAQVCHLYQRDQRWDRRLLLDQNCPSCRHPLVVFGRRPGPSGHIPLAFHHHVVEAFVVDELLSLVEDLFGRSLPSCHHPSVVASAAVGDVLCP